MLQFEILTTDAVSHARRGTLTLNHGVVQPPVFMPVIAQHYRFFSYGDSMLLQRERVN